MNEGIGLEALLLTFRPQQLPAGEGHAKYQTTRECRRTLEEAPTAEIDDPAHAMSSPARLMARRMRT